VFCLFWGGGGGIVPSAAYANNKKI